MSRLGDGVSVVRPVSALLFVSVISVSWICAQALPPQEIFTQVHDSVVVVLSYEEANELRAFGSGVVLGAGRVITNYHVIADARALAVKHGSEVLTARLGRIDVRRDLAELLVEGLPGREIPFCPLEEVRVGARVYAIGTPEGLELTISEGLVSGTRDLGSGVEIQTSSPISHGSSGGGLFDDSGRLVGITTWSLRRAQNLNFAIPVAAIADMLGQPEIASAETPSGLGTNTIVPWSPTVTNKEVSEAIAAGARERGKEQGLLLEDVEQQFAAGLAMSDPKNVEKYGASSGFSVVLYSPITWIRQQSSTSAKLYKPFTENDVTAQMRADYVLVAINPNTPYYATAPSMELASSVEHAVLRDVGRRIAVQPANQGGYEVNVGNAYGTTVRLTGMVAAFRLQDLRRVRGPKGDGEFFVTVIGTNGTERDFKVKRKHFGRLPLPAAYWQMTSKEDSSTAKVGAESRRPGPAPDGAVLVTIKCHQCRAEWTLQANLKEGRHLVEGAYAFPDSDRFRCPGCGEVIEVGTTRKLVEDQTKRRIIANQRP